MAVPNLPLWPFEPDWADGVTETLEWLTDVLRSPSGAEQRRCLRPYPRRSFEFNVALEGSERSHFDNLVTAYGGREWLLPLWHDIHHPQSELRIGQSMIRLPTAQAGEFRAGDAALVVGTLPFEIEMVEIRAVRPTGLYLVSKLARSWSLASRVFPLRRARLTDQPTPRRESDRIITSRVRFSLTERNNGVGLAVLPQYRGFPILTTEPDAAEPLDYGYERMLEQIDNQTAIPFTYDSANISFPNQKYAWTLSGRTEHNGLRSLIYALRGKLAPVWLPTFMSDFELAAPIKARSNLLRVRNVGFGRSGGPRPGRQHLLLELYDGTQMLMLVTSAATAGSQEVLAVDRRFEKVIEPEDVLRISFVALNRLNQDNIEIVHQTDSEGTSTLNAIFRSTPDLRHAELGIGS